MAGNGNKGACKLEVVGVAAVGVSGVLQGWERREA